MTRIFSLLRSRYFGSQPFGSQPLRCCFVAALILLTGISALSANAQTKPERIKGETVPRVAWETVSPESVGYSTARLEALRAWVKTDETAANSNCGDACP